MPSNEKIIDWVKYWQDSIDDYRRKIAYYDEKLEKAKGSETRLKCYQGLKKVCEQRIEECRKNIQRLLAGGYGDI